MFPQDNPDGTVSVRLTSPEKWFKEPIVIVEFAEKPALTGPGTTMDIAKSRNWKVAVALWTSGVLVPIIVAV
jgi:hypothetical protein